jgi:16S rRNA processing protein RimM
VSLIACGRLGRPHGVRGALRIWPFNVDTDLIRAQRPLTIGRSPKRTRTLTIRSARRDAKGWIVTFDGIIDRDAAAHLTNATWFETREDFGHTADDEVFIADLVGLAVSTESGEALGTIKDVWQAGAADVLVIRGARGEHLVPNVPEFVLRLDPANPPAIIRPIDGLLGE